MDYSIYTYGGGELLISVFNAIGMIFKSDNTYLTPVGTTALVIGGVYGGTIAIFKGDIAYIFKHWMLPSTIIFLFLFAPKSTVWIKDEVEMNAPVKVDNIPVGISFFTSLSSNISHHLARLLEETMLPVQTLGATHTGILYGAKAVAKLRDARIQDPILLRNVKEYMRQCYMKPYVIGNFGGLRAESIRSTDILEFLNAHPVKCFGIKPTDATGTIGKFMTCAEAGKKIKVAVTEASKAPALMSKLGSSLGLSSNNPDLMTRHIRSMTADTLGYLEQGQHDIYEWMKQAMMLNANREAYDDWREKVGHSRVFPELIKMQATRGMFQQSLGSIVGAETAESMIPAAAQPVMLSLVVMCFVIILPFAMLPGGWQYIMTGIKLMIWVCSWPVFYTIIHAIAMIQLKGTVGGWGEEGLSLIGQGGFTEILLWKYGTAQSLITSVPFISFAIVFGSPYALSSIAGGVASVSGASTIGANMADANLSLAQTSIGNISRGQHNEVPTLMLGSGVIDDGAMRVQADHSGNQIITEHQDQMAVNYNVSDALTSQSGMSLANAKSDMASISYRESEQETIVSSQNIDVARSIAQGTTTASNLSIGDVESLRTGFGIDKSSNKSDSAVDSRSTGTNAHLGVNIPEGIGAITGLSGGTSTNASNNYEVRSDMTVQERQAFNTALDKVKTAARNDSLTTNNSEDMRLNRSFAANLSKQEQIANEKARTMQDIDTYSKQLSYLESNSGNINRNVNNQVMEKVMQKHPELKSKQQAAKWMQNNRIEADAIAKGVMSSYDPFYEGGKNSFEANENLSRVERIVTNAPDVRLLEISTKDRLYDKHKENATNVREQAIVTDVTRAQKPLEKIVGDSASNSNLRYNENISEVLGNNLSNKERESVAELNKGRIQDKDIIKSIIGEGDKAKNNTSTVVRVVENIGNDSTAVLEKISGDKNNKKDKK